jgi:hypothetical protein
MLTDKYFGSVVTVDDEKNSVIRRRALSSIATDFPGKPAASIFRVAYTTLNMEEAGASKRWVTSANNLPVNMVSYPRRFSIASKKQ